MSPCFQGDPGPGYVPKEHGPYQSQEQCEEDCSQLGACCTPTGCEQQTRCDCLQEDGNVFFGPDSECAEGICACECNAEALGLSASSTLTVTFNGLKEKCSGGQFGNYAQSPNIINGHPLCFTKDDQSLIGGECQFSSVACMLFRGYTSFDTFPGSYLISFCVVDDVIRVRFSAPYAFAWDYMTAAGEWPGPYTFSTFPPWVSTLYDVSEATMTLSFDECDPPANPPERCCAFCSTLGEQESSLVPSIDVTISNVTIAAGATTAHQNFANFEGTYTVPLSPYCAYEATFRGDYGFPNSWWLSFNENFISIAITPQQRCNDAIDWFLTLSAGDTGFGGIPPNIAPRGVFGQVIDSSESPSCCPSNTSFTLTSNGLTATIDIECNP